MDGISLANLLADVSEATEIRRVSATMELQPQTQKNDGQFFTPMAVAEFVASKMPIKSKSTIRVLDPGAGVGSLTVALFNRLILETDVETIELVAIEKDSQMIPFLSKTLEALVSVGVRAGKTVLTKIANDDFISMFTTLDGSSGDFDLAYDFIIMNPPYGKIGTASPERQAIRTLGVDCPNLYSGFITLSLRLLEMDGSLVAIVPRSFMNGTYFLDFRRDFLSQFNMKIIHLFDSRSNLFSDTGVLQENVIIAGTRGKQASKLEISISEDHLECNSTKKVDFSEIVLPDDSNKFIRIPSTSQAQAVIRKIEALPCSLKDLGISVSTGRVVDFRVRDKLSSPANLDESPLVYPGNLKDGQISWPRLERKPQSISQEMESLLLPNEVYVITKRFSSKEERRRIVAAVWEPSISKSKTVGFENHLNVFHINNRGLPRDLAYGLLYWLNGSIIDDYFRVFSGHTQVNAGDLRSLLFPSIGMLEDIGKNAPKTLPSQEMIDARIEKYLGNKMAVA